MNTIVASFTFVLGCPACGEVEPKKEKTYTVDFKEVEWSKVFEWYAKETGLTYIDVVKVEGTLTLKSKKPWTRCELDDALNDALEPRGYYLIRRHQTFFIHPKDERLPRDLSSPPQISVSELQNRCDSEIVQVLLPQMKTIVVEDVLPQLKKLLSPFGEVYPFGSNQIVVQDKVKNIRNIMKYLDEILESGWKTVIHKCQYVCARDLAAKLDAALNAEAEKAHASQGGWGGSGWGGGWGGSGSGWGGWGAIDPKDKSPEKKEVRPTIKHWYQIIASESTNTVIVCEIPHTRYESIRTMIADLDKPPVCQPVICQPMPSPCRPRPLARLFGCRR